MSTKTDAIKGLIDNDCWGTAAGLALAYCHALEAEIALERAARELAEAQRLRVSNTIQSDGKPVVEDGNS